VAVDSVGADGFEPPTARV